MGTLGTIDTRYLFPSFPSSKSLCKKVLSADLFSNKHEPVPTQGDVIKVTSELKRALRDTDSIMLNENHSTALELDITLFKKLVTKKLLRRKDGRKVVPRKELKGKYIIACCLSVPNYWSSPARELAKKSVKLYGKRKDDFELVIFLRKRRYDWEKYANVDDFLKPFHPSCIVCRLSPHYSDCIGDNQALVIDPKERTLLRKSVSFLSEIGSEAFPFSDADVESVSTQYMQLKHSSLEILLGVEPSHKVFRKLPGTDPLRKEWRCISDFQSKIVFLYTYSHGDRLAFLYNNVISLREKGIEFEIITVYVPGFDYHNPLQFLKVFSSLVAQLGLSWWFLPHNSSTYLRLKPCYSEATYSDHLIVFDPKLKDGDPHGFEVLRLYGESMFPFAKMSVVDHVMKELTQVTLRSLFEPISRIYKEGDQDEYDTDVGENKSVLTGKNVLVYFESCQSDSSALDQFVSWYKSLEGKRRNFEVVFVYLSFFLPEHNVIIWRPQFQKWLIFPEEEKVYSKYVVDNFFLKLFKHKFSTVVAFGKDGKICSLRAHSLMSSDEAVTFPFNGDLPTEIFNILNDNFAKILAYPW